MVLLYENKEVIQIIQTTAGLEYMISTKIKSLIDIDKKTIGIAQLDKENPIETEKPIGSVKSTLLNYHREFKKRISLKLMYYFLTAA